MGCESSDVARFDLGSLLQGQMRVAKLKSAFNLLIIEKCWPFPVDTSCIWPLMHPWSSLCGFRCFYHNKAIYQTTVNSTTIYMVVYIYTNSRPIKFVLNFHEI